MCPYYLSAHIWQVYPTYILTIEDYSQNLRSSIYWWRMEKEILQRNRWITRSWEYTESAKYYARPQTAVARDLGLPAGRQAGHYTHAASKHSLPLFSIWRDLKISEKILRVPMWRWGVWIWLTGPSGLHRNHHSGFFTRSEIRKSQSSFAPHPILQYCKNIK